MSMVDKFQTWAIVEIMGHRVYAGFVTEQLIAGRGFLRIDVPEDRTVSYSIVPAYTKVFGTDAVFSISPCTEEAARKFNTGGFPREGSKLLTPPNPAPSIVPLSDADIERCRLTPENSASLHQRPTFESAQAALDAFSDEHEIRSEIMTEEEIDLQPVIETPLLLNPGDEGFVDPVFDQPF